MSNIDYGYLSQNSTFDFGERRKPDMVLGNPQPIFYDSHLGKMTRWGSLQHKAEHFYTDPYYQYHKPTSIQFDKRSNIPKKKFVRAKNAGTITPPPLSFRHPFFKLPEVKRAKFEEPKETQSFETGVNAPEHSQKFVFSQTPMENLQRQFYEGNIHNMNTSEKRKDRDGLLDYLHSSGHFEQSDLQKPISALINKIYEKSDSDQPFLGNPLMQEIETRNLPSKQTGTSTQEQRNQQAIQGIGQLNQQQSAGVVQGLSRVVANDAVNQAVNNTTNQSGAVQASEILPQSSETKSGASGADASAGAGSELNYFGSPNPIPQGTRVPVTLRDSGKTLYVASGGGIYATPTSNNTKKVPFDEKREAMVTAGFDDKTIKMKLGIKQT